MTVCHNIIHGQVCYMISSWTQVLAHMHEPKEVKNALKRYTVNQTNICIRLQLIWPKSSQLLLLISKKKNIYIAIWGT